MTEFEEVYKTYFGDVFRYLRRLSGDEELAEELTAETFFKALGSIEKFRGECELRVWLCQIAKNCYYSHIKKRAKTESLDDLDFSAVADSSPSPEELVEKSDEAARLRGALHALPEPYREVFMWRVFGELNFKQIGKLFGKTENWACVTYHRAKKMIKERTEGGQK